MRRNAKRRQLIETNQGLSVHQLIGILSISIMLVGILKPTKIDVFFYLLKQQSIYFKNYYLYLQRAVGF